MAFNSTIAIGTSPTIASTTGGAGEPGAAGYPDAYDGTRRITIGAVGDDKICVSAGSAKRQVTVFLMINDAAELARALMNLVAAHDHTQSAALARAAAEGGV